MLEPQRPEAGLLLATLDELPTGVWVARAPNGELTYANRLFAEILGTGARADVGVGEYVPAYGIHDRTGKPYAEDRLPFVRALRERRTVVVDDLVIVRPDGTKRYVRAFGKPLFDAAGEISNVMVAFSDISDQVAIEAERSAAWERLRIAVHHAPILLFTTDIEGNVTLSEGAALAGLGFSSGELVGRNAFDLYAEDAQVHHNLRRALAGEAFTSVTELGETVLETWMAPLRDGCGEIEGVIGVSTDVTEKLRMQRQMAHADRMSGLGRLAASVAHEINNPLAYTIESVRQAGELAAKAARALLDSDASQDLAQLRRLLEDAMEGAERVRLITRDLQAFARPDEDSRQAVQVDDAIATAVKLVGKRTSTRAEVALDVESAATVHADENRLVQIFVNLISNAAEALPSGATRRHRIRVSSRLLDSEKQVLIEVADDGPGVPPDLCERIFDPFFTTKSAAEGTGLGLYVTRNLVSALSGTIAVGRAKEGGALFTVRLPVASERERGRAASTRSPRGTVRPRVMIVDDEPMLARVLRMALEDDCDVRSFESAPAALAEMLAGAQYDVIFCDLMMADGGGLELYDQLRAHAPGRERNLVFMTGGIFDPRVAERLAAIPNHCVDKPFDIRVEVWKHLAIKADRA